MVHVLAWWLVVVVLVDVVAILAESVRIALNLAMAVAFRHSKMGETSPHWFTAVTDIAKWH